MLKITEESYNYILECEKKLKDIFMEVDDICNYNSLKVLKAFQKYNVSENHFIGTTGYGYNDIGRDTIELIFADIFNKEDALVRNQLISGSHALTVSFFGILRPSDTLLSISGLPYDTMHEVIGLKNNDSSLKSFNVNYEQIDLVDDDFDYKKIEEALKSKKIKLIEIQRSKGYSTRKSISVSKINKVYDFIKSIDKDVIIMIDNCYCEFVSKEELKGDIIVGSLIKNLGGGISPNGAYIVGDKKLIKLISERLTLPGEGKEVGPSLGINKSILMGLYFAPSVVASSIKTSILTAYVMESLGYNVEPKYDSKRVDIVQNIIFNDRDKLIKYCGLIQGASAIDSNVMPIPDAMPGYDDEIIMASGSFTQGSSIELSCDGPLREPFIAYQQGSLMYSYGRLAVMNVYEEFKNK